MPVPPPERIVELVSDLLAREGYDLEDVVVTAAGKHSTVRLLVDSDAGLGLDEAARLSRIVSEAFDGVSDFGESPYVYLLTRRLERAAALLRNTDHSVAEVCLEVGLQGVGSFTTSFKRMYGMTPTAYRESSPPAASQARLPGCVVRAYARPQHRTFREDTESDQT